MSPRNNPRRRRRVRTAMGVAVGMVGAALLLALVSPGPPPEGTGPQGTLALERLLTNLGHLVVKGDSPARGETYVLLEDRRDATATNDVLGWVAQGGRLVLADPHSNMMVPLGVEVLGPIPVLTGGKRTDMLTGDCFSSLAAGAATIEVRTTDLRIQGGYHSQLTCFAGAPGPYEVIAPFGKGSVVVLGGPSALQNGLLNHADNAEFAVGILGTRHVVMFGSDAGEPPSDTSSGAGGLWGAIPFAAKAVLLQLALALIAFALVRARRLGRPVAEDPLSPIPAGELVQATSRLYRKGRATAFSGQLLRDGAEAALRRRLGLPAGDPTQHVAEETARITGRPEPEVRQILDGPPTERDDELIALGRQVEEVRRAVESATR